MKHEKVESLLAKAESVGLCERQCQGCPVMLLPAIITLVRGGFAAAYEISRDFIDGFEIPGDSCTQATKTQEIRFGFSFGGTSDDIGIECVNDAGNQMGVFYLKADEILIRLPSNIKIENGKIFALQRIMNRAQGASNENKVDEIWRSVEPLTGVLLSDARQSLGIRISTSQLNLARMESGRTPLTEQMVKLIEGEMES